MRTDITGFFVTLVAVFTAIQVFNLSVARADEATDELIATLKEIAANKTEEVNLRREAILSLRMLEYEDATFFGGMATDKEENRSIRADSLQNLAIGGSSDATVQQTLSTIVPDKSDAEYIRGIAISVAGGLGVDDCGLRDELQSVCGDTSDETGVRIAAIGVIARDPGENDLGTLSGILSNSGEEGKVRLAVLSELRGSQDAAYINALKSLISTKLSQEELDVPLRFSPIDDEFHPLKLRSRAIGVVSGYAGNTDLVLAAKAVAVDTTDDEFSRLAAINMLSRNLVQTSAIETLTSVVNEGDNSAELRIVALAGLCRANSEAAYSLLCNYVANTGAPLELRKSAIDLVAARMPRSKYNWLERLQIKNGLWDNCSTAVAALLGVAADEGEEMDLREKAVRVLHYTIDTGALVALRNFAQDSSVANNLRIIAIRNLSLDSGSVSVLESIASDEEENQGVRDAATKALETASE